jgi:hypothetical protein
MHIKITTIYAYMILCQKSVIKYRLYC